MAPQIRQCIQRAWYNSAVGMGAQNLDFRHRMSGVTLSLVATALWGALKQYESGERSNASMKTLAGQGMHVH
jgi:hypothetical protein